MNARIFKMAVVAGVAAFCVSSFGQWLPTGTSTTDAKYRSGNVAIGVTSANSTAKMYVKSTAANLVPMIVNTYNASPTVDIARFQINGTSKVVINNGGGINVINDGGNQLSMRTASQMWDLDVDVSASNNFRLRNMTAGTVPLTVTTNGNVGIGITDPTNALAVNGFITATGGITCGSINAFNMDGTPVANLIGPVQITGKVGIGVYPGPEIEALEVAGNIKCNAVKINNWTIEAPDYVFEKDYKLPSLKVVEKHIAANKHLPGVPSASEMKKNGLDLTQMNMTLLKKVEELTLYVIEQNKKIEALESKVSDK